MSKKERKKAVSETLTKRSLNPLGNLKSSTRESVTGILLFVVGLFFLLAAFSKGGKVGAHIYDWFTYLLGIGYYLLPVILFILSTSFFGEQNRSFSLHKILGATVFIISGLGLFDLASDGTGGVIGDLIASPLVNMFDVVISTIALIAGLIISLLIIFDTALHKETLMFWRRRAQETDGAEDEYEDDEEDLKPARNKKMKISSGGEEIEDEENEYTSANKRTSVLEKIKDKVSSAPTNKDIPEPEATPLFAKKAELLGKEYNAPSLDLLEKDAGKPGVGDIKANANIIKRTLQNFGIDVEMDEISIGPSVTRYALKPAEGVKLSKILGLQNNLSLALAAHPIRIEAPIPGKSLVGIEIPNTVKTKVGLGSLLAQDEYKKSEKPLLAALGKGISGKSHFGDLAKMPHLLVAGATGSGKSVTAHAIITSLLYRNSPENLRFIMIDPKRVELTLYNGIPHLLTPVITDAKKAIMSLRWAAKEMDRRYDLLEKNSVRDIGSYHKNILMPALEKKKKDAEDLGDENNTTSGDIIDPMPYIVVMIDELADIMQAYPRELESGIVRLAQMSRAVGIHLILSTQRPSVNVITGLIKANVPARIALQVASQIDSRTILDMRGAEELLGAGDMLYMSGDMSSPVRLQSAFVTENEIKKIVKHLKDNADSLNDEIVLGGAPSDQGVNDPIFSAGSEGGMGSGDDDVDDDLYEEAKDIVIKAGKASTSYIQRKLRVGYARAARLMDILEDKGIIGPADGSKPREVIGGRDSGHDHDESSDNNYNDEGMENDDSEGVENR